MAENKKEAKSIIVDQFDPYMEAYIDLRYPNGIPEGEVFETDGVPWGIVIENGWFRRKILRQGLLRFARWAK